MQDRRLAALAGFVLALAPALAAATEARDPTVGLCTRKDDFAKAAEEIDPRIQALSAAAEAEKAALGKAIADAFGLDVRIEVLIRYRETDMVHVLVPLSKAENWAIRQRALYALKMVGGPAAVDAAADGLKDENPRVREMAANCLCHAAESVPEALRAALETETDRYARSSMEAAVRTIEAGPRPYGPWPETLVGPEGAKRVEWAWTVQGKASFNRLDAKSLDTPRTDSFDWPISWYEDSLFCPVPRPSFGANGNHCGEDMAWFREGASVYAAADGLVRMVQGAGGNWGTLIAVEHRFRGGMYLTALYGHCAHDVLVKPGETVVKGQKLGTVGLSCSVENGGYGAHLHFGLSQGPFRKPKQIRRGVKINLQFGEQKVPTPVLALVYHPTLKDAAGLPRLGLVVKFPDGQQKVVPGPDEPLLDQLAWCTGYAKNCVGWYDPRKLIEAMQKKEREAAAEPAEGEAPGEDGPGEPGPGDDGEPGEDGEGF